MKSTLVEKAVQGFMQSLRQRNASKHTIKAYSGDLEVFAAYIGSRNWKEIDHVTIRGFLSRLYENGLGKTSVARGLAAVRSLYRWLAQEGVVEQNPAALISTPKLAKKLPRVPTIEEMNNVLDGNMPEVAAFPERDRMMLELLYGCGIRNSELDRDRHRGYPFERRSYPDSRQREERALCSLRRRGQAGARGIPAGASAHISGM